MTELRKLEHGVELLLLDDLLDVDDDDTVRVAVLLEGLIEDVLEYGHLMNLDVTPEDAVSLMRSMVRRGVTAGELRASCRRVLGELATEGGSA